METKDLVTAATAIIGACTGTAGLVISLLNHRRATASDRVRLRVVVSRSQARGFDGAPIGQPWISIDVVNLSAFNVTLAEVGFRRSSGDAIAFLNTPGLPFQLPYVLHPRRKATFPFRSGLEHDHRFADVVHAYATCEDDEFAIGETELLQELTDRARSLNDGSGEPPTEEVREPSE